MFFIFLVKPTFLLSSFTFIKRLFSSSLLSAITVVSPAYLRLLVFLLEILFQLVLHPAQHFSWCTLHISLIRRVTIYSLDILLLNLEPVCSMSTSNCCFLTCIPISQAAGQVVWYAHLFQNFPQFVVIHMVKGFALVNKADVFLELSCFFNDPTDVGNLISGSSAFSKSSLNIWKFMVHVLLKPALESFEHYFASMWDDCNCAGSLSILWHWLSVGLEWKLTFSSAVATAKFSKFADILSAALSQHHLSGFEIAQLEFHHLH